MPTPYKKYDVEARIYDKDNNIIRIENFTVEAKTFKSAITSARVWLYEHNVYKAMLDIRKGKEVHYRIPHGTDISENRKMFLKEIEKCEG